MKRILRDLLALASGLWLIGSCGGGQLSAADRQPARPNVLIFLADDMGFSDLGCYGGEISTPHLDELAKNGLRFTQFYNTSRCWPTRAAVMTGYYPQQVRRDKVEGVVSGGGGVRPAWARLLPEMLQASGYRSYHSGKWHIDGEPVKNGFVHSYNLTDSDRYCHPQKHAEDGQPLEAVKPGSGYYATTAIADFAIKCLREHGEQHADQPFFCYVAFIAPHFPLHALPEDIERYRDHYKEGWDVVRQRRWKRARELGIISCELPRLDEQLQPRYFDARKLARLGAGEVMRAVSWQTLTDEQRRFQTEKMAIHAAMVDRMDREIGRVIAQLRASDSLDNTLILFASDNGADATLMIRGDGHDPTAPMGSPETFLCLGPGWASASNAPFRRHKVWTHEGGISTPLIAHWPKGIAAHGELRRDVSHMIDIVPTVLDVTGTARPPLMNGAPVPPGSSLASTFSHDGVLKHDHLFFQHEGNRALRKGKWKIVSSSEDGNEWELYDLDADRAESKNLSATFPDKLHELEAIWKRDEADFRATASADVSAREAPPAKSSKAAP